MLVIITLKSRQRSNNLSFITAQEAANPLLQVSVDHCFTLNIIEHLLLDSAYLADGVGFQQIFDTFCAHACIGSERRRSPAYDNE